MSKKAFWALLVLAVAAKALGAEHEGVEHEEGGIPTTQIMWQAVNLGILLLAIFFFIRKSIVEAFAARRQNFIDQAEKTKTALRQAEQSLSEIKSKLSALESGEQASIENAKRDAQQQKETLVKDAQVAVEKMKKDAQLMMANELTKAKNEINAAIMNQAVQVAQQKISQSQASHASTQEAHFLQQIGQVN